jgi:plasmid stabilization system protein ParE
VSYVAQTSLTAARALRVRLGDAADQLRVYPHLGRTVPEFGDESIREIIVGRYRLVYRVDGDPITVVTIIHGSRDLRRHLPDGPWDIR